MRAIQAIVLASVLAALPAGVVQAQAQDPLKPAGDAQPLPQVPAAPPQFDIKRMGEPHTSALGKFCLSYEPNFRAHAANQNIFDYLVIIRNACPKSIKVKICPKNSYECNRVAVHPYQRQETIVGFGPPTGGFVYTAKEDP